MIHLSMLIGSDHYFPNTASYFSQFETLLASNNFLGYGAMIYFLFNLMGLHILD